MSDTRQLHLNVFLFPIGHHEAAWRLPESDPFATTELDYYVQVAQLAEAAKLDSVFFADAPALGGRRVLGSARSAGAVLAAPGLGAQPRAGRWPD